MPEPFEEVLQNLINTLEPIKDLSAKQLKKLNELEGKADERAEVTDAFEEIMESAVGAIPEDKSKRILEPDADADRAGERTDYEQKGFCFDTTLGESVKAKYSGKWAPWLKKA